MFQLGDGSRTLVVTPRGNVTDPRLDYEGTGTPQDPHVFLGEVRDHRGLVEGSADYLRFWRAVHLLQTAVDQVCSNPSYQHVCSFRKAALSKLKGGQLPFETFTNLADGKRWGKYFDFAENTVITAPAPPPSGLWDYVERAASYIGDAVVWFVRQTWKAVVSLCGEFSKATSNEKETQAAIGIISLAAGTFVPGAGYVGAQAALQSAVKTAKKICAGIQFVNGLLEGAPEPPEVEDIEGGGRPSTRVISSRDGRPIVTFEPVYPPGTFSVYDPTASVFHVLGPM